MSDRTSDSEAQTIVQAATVVVYRQSGASPPEILMVQRSKALSFAGAASVFPGGKLNDADVLLGSCQQIDDAASRIAAIREVLEETGLIIGIQERPSADDARAARDMLLGHEDLALVLDSFGWNLDLRQLTPFAHWKPAHKQGRIFDTRFYLADLGSGQIDLSADMSENTRLFWTNAADALVKVRSGEIEAIYPTLRNLERLAQFANFAEAKAHALCTPVVTVSPVVEELEGVEMLRIPDGIGYPVTLAPRY